MNTDMAKIPRMTPATLTTILNSAPMVIQGAGKLIDLIREQTSKKPENAGQDVLTLESLQDEIEELKKQLDSVNESNIEQIKLIEQLARQNEALAESLGHLNSRLNRVTLLAITGLLIACPALVFILLQ